MNFAEAAKKTTEFTLTENGAFAYNTAAQGALLDMFSVAGALRSRSEGEIIAKFKDAFAEDALLATKLLFYAGNIRGGLGERRTFQICLNWLAQNHPEIAIKNIMNVPHFNRWDILIKAYLGTDAEDQMWTVVEQQLRQDCHNYYEKQPISLLAKWLPSVNASSKATRRLAKIAFRKLHFLNEKEYRTVIHQLREYLRVVENLMSHGRWGEINYEAVPSKAMLRYRNAYAKRDNERFREYQQKLAKGEAKINASTLYPYDLVEKYTKHGWCGQIKEDEIVEAQWKALPNYLTKPKNILVMADVSGSMSGRPMDTSVGLAIYFAERNQGDYHNLYMTFTNNPHYVQIKEEATLAQKVCQVMATDVGYNTNLEKAFETILKTAVTMNVSPENMPEALVVISDMEIDNYMRWYGVDFVDEMKKRFEAEGYQFPKLILWNVEARKDTFLTQSQDVIMISGHSPSQFKALINCLDKSGYEVMLEVLNDPMYDCVVI